MTAETQASAESESRTERAAITLTRSEKTSLRLVSSVDLVDESTLLRNNTVEQIMARADEIRRKLDGAA